MKAKRPRFFMFLICWGGATAFAVIFGAIAAAIVGDFPGSFLRIVFIFVGVFLAPLYLFPVVDLILHGREDSVYWAAGFYYGSFAARSLLKTGESPSDAIVWGTSFAISLVVCILIFKIKEKNEKINELESYERFVKQWEEPAEKQGKGPYVFIAEAVNEKMEREK